MHLGWYYVERLADGQKGWVPISATREIESNHIRARNFKQRHAFLKLLTSMSATENNGHDLLNNNNNQTNKYHVTFEDWNTYLWTTKNTSAPRATDAALVPKRDEESTICFWIFSFKFYWCRTKTQLCYTTNVIFTAKYYYEIDHEMPFLRLFEEKTCGWVYPSQGPWNYTILFAFIFDFCQFWNGTRIKIHLSFWNSYEEFSNKNHQNVS